MELDPPVELETPHILHVLHQPSPLTPPLFHFHRRLDPSIALRKRYKMRFALIIILLVALERVSALSQSVQPRKWVVPQGVPFGDIARLELLPENVRDEDGTPSSDAVRIATKAVGLNFADIFTVLGYYKAANLVRTPSSTDFKLTLTAFCPVSASVIRSGKLLSTLLL